MEERARFAFATLDFLVVDAFRRVPVETTPLVVTLSLFETCNKAFCQSLLKGWSLVCVPSVPLDWRWMSSVALDVSLEGDRHIFLLLPPLLFLLLSFFFVFDCRNSRVRFCTKSIAFREMCLPNPVFQMSSHHPFQFGVTLGFRSLNRVPGYTGQPAVSDDQNSRVAWSTNSPMAPHLAGSASRWWCRVEGLHVVSLEFDPQEVQDARNCTIRVADLEMLPTCIHATCISCHEL